MVEDDSEGKALASSRISNSAIAAVISYPKTRAASAAPLDPPSNG